MKKLNKIAVAAGMLAGAVSIQAAKTPAIDNVEPPYWWTGMANDTLQIMLTGPGIGEAEFSLDYPGVRLADQVKLDSPNYKFLYLILGPEARPGTLDFRYTLKGKKGKLDYSLLARDRKPEEYKGFDASDVLYLLMPDRFAQASDKAKAGEESLEYRVKNDRTDPNARHGGDIGGIRDRLPYLDSLGVTAVWVCPVLENDMPGGSYHGYATTDYYRIDPRFGSNADWQQLVADAHNLGIKVVMDMIFNHSGSNHPWMKDMPAKDWYNHPSGDTLTNFRLTTVHDPYVSDYDLDHTVNGWFVSAMPDLNQKNPHLRKYLTQNSIWWIESSKINGIRMDTYPYADSNAMSQWAADVMREYPDFNIVGECWYANEAGQAFWQKGNRMNPEETNLPTVMDFNYILKGREAFGNETTYGTGLEIVYDHLSNDFLFPDPQKILTFLDNHDSDRFLASMPEDSLDLARWKQAQTFLLTSRGIPQIYYGTELLMNGGKAKSDGYIRLDMPGGFKGDKTDAFTREGRTEMQNEAWDFLSKLLHWRRGEANDLIARGKLKHFMPRDGVYVYERRLGDRSVTVMMNGTDREVSIPTDYLREILPAGKVLRNILTDCNVTIDKEMRFSPREVLILQ